jgi:hypothetical protein
MIVNAGDLAALQYIKNTGGCATLENFYEDHEPIGKMVWTSLVTNGLATFSDEDRIVKMTEAGRKALEAATPQKDFTV